MTDAFAAVADLPGVADAVDDAREAVDRLLGHRILRRRSAEVSTESALRGARASAVLEGSPVTLDELRTTENPSDPVVQGTLRVSAELGTLTDVWRKAPRQALARLHVLAAADAVDGAELGRPRSGDGVVKDVLGLGEPPAPSEVAARLDALSGLLTEPTKAPALVVSSIVHGELLALRPFGWGTGSSPAPLSVSRWLPVASTPSRSSRRRSGTSNCSRSMPRPCAATRPVRPRVARWVAHCSAAVAAAARDSQAICEAFMRG